MTGQDLISASLRLIGVLASGEAPSASEANDALSTLNDLLDCWSTESLLINTKVREVFPLVSGQQSYAMGTGGDFDTTRPQKIENAIIQLISNNPPIELPMKILNKDQYAGIILKALVSDFPLYVYADGAYPLENINVWPVPVNANNLVLYSWKPLTEVASLTADLIVPPGYLRALRFNLAIDLAAEFGRPITPEIAGIAAESKANIKRMNSGPHYLQVDESLRAKPAVWNWMTGEPT